MPAVCLHFSVLCVGFHLHAFARDRHGRASSHPSHSSSVPCMRYMAGDYLCDEPEKLGRIVIGLYGKTAPQARRTTVC